MLEYLVNRRGIELEGAYIAVQKRRVVIGHDAVIAGRWYCTTCIRRNDDDNREGTGSGNIITASRGSV